jgi:hypothetical protein
MPTLHQSSALRSIHPGRSMLVSEPTSCQKWQRRTLLQAEKFKLGIGVLQLPLMLKQNGTVFLDATSITIIGLFMEQVWV